MGVLSRESLLNCPRDDYYPRCENCRPNTKNICPLYSGGLSSRKKSTLNLLTTEYIPGPSRIDYISQSIYSTDIEKILPDNFDLKRVSGTVRATNKRHKPERLTGQGKKSY